MIVIFDLDDTLFDTTGQLMPNISLFSDTLSTLDALDAVKVLVTRGDKKLQEQKIAILGIRKCFDDIIICPTPDDTKKAAFELILKKYAVSARDAWVVGDRINVEIRSGNLLGMNTVHFHHGKHKDLKPQDAFDKPMFVIKKLKELCRLIPCKQ